ncbi:hypothetical protein L1987_43430 [Smallanthus sonchifolius]|uniref:Uncharacterized protein n=1 Tax=Smallanthus sonchifolius TaxID=185202 RepID=A0ACB9GNM9_9ASTR|nr:hypothetical protein L1987_43430 [Smallanthus sonchifolius]
MLIRLSKLFRLQIQQFRSVPVFFPVIPVIQEMTSWETWSNSVKLGSTTVNVVTMKIVRFRTRRFVNEMHER